MSVNEKSLKKLEELKKTFEHDYLAVKEKIEKYPDVKLSINDYPTYAFYLKSFYLTVCPICENGMNSVDLDNAFNERKEWVCDNCFVIDEDEFY